VARGPPSKLRNDVIIFKINPYLVQTIYDF
jgi:hypothetical protein